MCVYGGLPNVAAAKHALDERRCPFATTVSTPRLSRRLVRRLQERRSAGVHGDIGGQNRDRDRPRDIAFSWMAKNAQAARPAVNAKLYRQRVRVDSTMTSRRPYVGVILPYYRWWWLARGWHLRPIQPDDELTNRISFAAVREHVPTAMLSHRLKHRRGHLQAGLSASDSPRSGSSNPLDASSLRRCRMVDRLWMMIYQGIPTFSS